MKLAWLTLWLMVVVCALPTPARAFSLNIDAWLNFRGNASGGFRDVTLLYDPVKQAYDPRRTSKRSRHNSTSRRFFRSPSTPR